MAQTQLAFNQINGSFIHVKDYLSAAQLVDVETNAGLLDISAELAAAYSDAKTANNGNATLILGEGTFRIESQFVLDGKVGIFGSLAKELCTIKPVGTFDALYIDNGEFVKYTGFNIDGTNLTGVGIVANNGGHAYLDDIRVYNCSSHGIHWKGGNSAKLSHIDCVSNGRGGTGSGLVIESFAGDVTTANPSPGTLSSNTIFGSEVNVLSNKDWGLDIKLSDASVFINLIAQQNDNGGNIRVGAASGTDSIGNYIVAYCERAGNGTSQPEPDLELEAKALRNYVVLTATENFAGKIQDKGTDNIVITLNGPITQGFHNIQPTDQRVAATNGRNIDITGGKALGAQGGQINITGGEAEGTDKDGGNVNIQGGVQTGTGARGSVVIAANGNVTLGNASADIFLNGPYYDKQAQQALSVAGGASDAADITSQQTDLTTTGAGTATVTLADGAEGQYKMIFMESHTVNADITPTNMHAGTKITMTASGQFVVFKFTNAKWVVYSNPYSLTITP